MWLHSESTGGSVGLWGLIFTSNNKENQHLKMSRCQLELIITDSVAAVRFGPVL